MTEESGRRMKKSDEEETGEDAGREALGEKAREDRREEDGNPKQIESKDWWIE